MNVESFIYVSLFYMYMYVVVYPGRPNFLKKTGIFRKKYWLLLFPETKSARITPFLDVTSGS